MVADNPRLPPPPKPPRKRIIREDIDIVKIFEKLDETFDRTFKRGNEAFKRADDQFKAAEQRMRDSEKRVRDKIQRVTKQDGDSITQVSISRDSPLGRMMIVFCITMIFLALAIILGVLLSLNNDTKPEALNPPAIEMVEGDRKL